MKSLIRLAIIIVLGIIGYNYFYGTVEEKAQSKEIVDEVGSAGKKIFKSVGNLLKSEKTKYENGKYDEAMGDLKQVFGKLKERANTEGSDIKQELKELDKRREKLEKDIQSDDVKTNEDKKKKLKDEFEKISEAAKILIEKMQNK